MKMNIKKIESLSRVHDDVYACHDTLLNTLCATCDVEHDVIDESIVDDIEQRACELMIAIRRLQLSIDHKIMKHKIHARVVNNA